MSELATDTMAIGRQLVELCNQGNNEEAIKTLYSDVITSVEPCDMPDMPGTQKGIEAVIAKAQWWDDNHEVHSGKCTGPYPHGDQFVVFFDYEVTAKSGPMAGQRMRIEEAGLYTVENGKIIKEQFFYDMG